MRQSDSPFGGQDVHLRLNYPNLVSTVVHHVTKYSWVSSKNVISSVVGHHETSPKAAVLEMRLVHEHELMGFLILP